MNTNEQMNNAIPTQLLGGIDGTGVYRTPQATINAVLANPTFGGCKLPPGADGVEVEPQSEPIPPDAPQMAREDRHMSYPEAIAILAELARKRSMSVDQVNALEIGVRRLMCRHFQRQRNWAKRRAAKEAEAGTPNVESLTPEEELADTIARQKEEA